MDNFSWFFNKIKCNELISVDDLINYLLNEDVICKSYCCLVCDSSVKLRKDKFKADGLFFICTFCKKNLALKKLYHMI